MGINDILLVPLGKLKVVSTNVCHLCVTIKIHFLERRINISLNTMVRSYGLNVFSKHDERSLNVSAVWSI